MFCFGPQAQVPLKPAIGGRFASISLLLVIIVIVVVVVVVVIPSLLSQLSLLPLLSELSLLPLSGLRCADAEVALQLQLRTGFLRLVFIGSRRNSGPRPFY